VRDGLATFFVGSRAVDALTPLGFREGERGANLWLLQPNDEGRLSCRSRPNLVASRLYSGGGGASVLR
jgi:hypothetical protein